MNVHVLQHVPFEGLGSIETWLASRGAKISYTRFFQSPQLPDLAELDCIIAMGGPMSVNDEAELPWLKAEKRFVAAAIDAGKAVLGICLGAQLMASTLGARVYPGPHKEIGWFDIESTSNHSALFQFPQAVTVFHWHGETFDLPAGATRLARSAVCENQAFQMGDRAIGLQFHLEMTPESVAAIIANCRHELIDGPYIQSEEQMRNTPAPMYAAVNSLMAELLAYLTR